MTPDGYLLIALAALLGLLIGSFLNVVILRLQPWLEEGWQREACELLEQSPPPRTAATLAFPASHCPQCLHPLRWWHNVPVLSFILLRGQCAFCHSRIFWQYPSVELINALWWAYCMSQSNGEWVQAFWWAVWGSVLMTLAWIDARTMLLPDVMTLPLLWAALALAAAGFTPVSGSQAIWGAVLGYGLLWLPAQIYAWITGRIGMAPGDFKLLAAIGASLGPVQLPITLLLASGLGLIFAATQALRQRRQVTSDDAHQAIPFGPALVAAAILQHLSPSFFALEWLR